MSADELRAAAKQARLMAETHRTIAPTLARLYGGDDCDSLSSARRHDAVAEWLEAKAEQDDKGTCDDPRGCCNLCEHDYGHVAALAVATAYLGTP